MDENNQSNIKRITLLRDSDYPNGEWRNKNGRPSAESVVEAFLRENPEARKCDVIRGTGLDKKTVYKYYEAGKRKNAVKTSRADRSGRIGHGRITGGVFSL